MSGKNFSAQVHTQTGLFAWKKWPLKAKTHLWDNVFTFKNEWDLPEFLCIYVY